MKKGSDLIIAGLVMGLGVKWTFSGTNLFQQLKYCHPVALNNGRSGCKWPKF